MKAIREAEWSGQRGADGQGQPAPARGRWPCGWSSPARPRPRSRPCRRCSRPPARGRRGGHPARPRAAGRGRHGSVLAGRRTGRRGRHRGAAPRSARRPRVPGPAARARARLLPGRRLRRAAAAGRAGHPAARLGEPALLAAAGLARCRAGAARDPARRRGHRRVHLPDRGRAGHRPGLRRGHRGDPPERHLAATCSSGSSVVRRRRCWSPPWTASRTARSCRDRSRPTASRWRPRSPSPTPRSTGPRPALPRRPAGPGLHAGAGRLDDVPRRAAQARPGAARATRRPGARERLAVDARPASSVGTATEPRRARHGAAARASGRCRAATGPAARASAPGEPVRADAGTAARSRTGTAPPGRARVRPAAGASPSDGRLRQPACCPTLLAERGLDRARRRASRPSSATARCARSGTLDAILAALRRPAAGRGRPAGARRAAARRLPAAAHPHPAARRGGDHRRPGPRSRAAAGPAGFVNAVLRRVAAARLGRAGVAQLAPPALGPIGHLALRHRAPAVDRRGLRGRARRRPRRDRRPPCSPTTSARRPTWSPGPGRIGRDELLRARPAARPGPWSPYAVRLGRRRPGRDWPPVRDRRAGVQDEGSQLCALALADAPLDGPRRALARPVRRPGRQGRAAGRARRRARRHADRQRAARRTAPSWSASVAGGWDVEVRRRATRARPAGPSRRYRPGAARRARAPASARCAAAPRRAGGAPPADVGDAWPRCSASCCAAALRLVRPGGVVALRDLLAAPGRDRRGRRRGHDRSVERSTRRRCSPGVARARRPGPTVQLWPHRHGTDAMFFAAAAACRS